MRTNTVEHSILKSLILHLLPGLLIGICYFALAPLVKANGFPSIMALILAGIFVLIPFEFGFILLQSKKTGEKLINGIIKYCKPIPKWQYLVWVPIIFVLSGILFTLFEFTTEHLHVLFNRIPSNMNLDMGLSTEFSKQNLVVTYVLFLIFIVLILPVIEEFYFRGYLLPRMPAKLRGWSVPVHSGLFALYHTWTPWMFITRAIGILPLIYIVKRKENIYLGIIAHCLLNSTDFILALIFLNNY
ncbi:MAG: hypothetical protein A2X13_14360 [Bacteroidetes bacterium GWC2_33_15]|nr:MAG: hypothetical protein A2X10_12405 [Bacteroidetes bacterium GWA2_33_15]OFX50057.1 MAG: hypothetical protein A2X13_14360 [Bacteroidetes bacterium GWC2_33_15]OFX65210.1 MAG: hypothetical protein A2X15_03935 [Bacteroidetes bacterium GWB2_32_14]OFX70436.1 MAG: hypothetical protein A2X14_03990 [Bacteroidetes bacterium GWD2_33_33]HAN19694.1 hypothetical protein [Bacteroidales bacterium]